MNNTTEFIQSDKAVEKIEDDLLNRTGMAKSISKVIKNWKNKDSLAIGIEGSWGSGKSSLKNFILEDLRKHENEVQILEFTPWSWSHAEKIHKAFFRELLIKIKKEKISNIIMGKISNYFEIFDKEYKKPFFDTSNILSGLLIVLGFSSIIESIRNFLKENTYAQIIIAVSSLLSIAIGIYITKKKNKDENTLEEKYEEVYKALKKYPKTIVIFFDELDRIDAEELKTIFQITKLNANFPNIVYVLLYDREIIEKKIKVFAAEEPKFYLEKIIQVNFQVPIITQNELYDILENGIKDIFSEKNFSNKSNIEEYIKEFYEYSKNYLSNIRQIKRYLSNLSFSAHFYDNTVYEVNPFDLMLLEIIRIFENNLYSKLYQEKNILIYNIEKYIEIEEIKQKLKMLYDCIQTDIDTIVKILKKLFPKIEEIEKSDDIGVSIGKSPSMFYNAQIHHPYMFERYFKKRLDEYDISFEKIEKIEKTIEDKKSNEKIIIRYKNDLNLYTIVTGLIYSTEYKIKNNKNIINPHNIISEFLYLIDFINDDYYINNSLPVSAHLTYKIIEIINKEDLENRIEIFKKAIDLYDGVYSIVKLYRYSVILEKNDNTESLFSKEDYYYINEIIQQRLNENLGNKLKIKPLKEMNEIFFYLKESDNKEFAQLFLNQKMQTKKGLLEIIRHILLSGFENYGTSLIKEKFPYANLSRDDILNAWNALNITNPTPEEEKLLHKFSKLQID